MKKAKTRIVGNVPKGMSKTEETWIRESVDALFGHFGKMSEIISYEGITFKVGSLSYTPDFIHQFEDGTLIIVEVKASKSQRDFAYSMARLKATAQKFPIFDFVLAVPAHITGWDITPIETE